MLVGFQRMEILFVSSSSPSFALSRLCLSQRACLSSLRHIRRHYTYCPLTSLLALRIVLRLFETHCLRTPPVRAAQDKDKTFETWQRSPQRSHSGQ